MLKRHLQLDVAATLRCQQRAGVALPGQAAPGVGEPRVPRGPHRPAPRAGAPAADSALKL